MKEKPDKTNLNRQKINTGENNNLLGYPPYPTREDIYGRFRKDRAIDPEDPASIKGTLDSFSKGKCNEMDFSDDLSGSDLDIPGSELDDDLEIIGSEDEENNYYSLGGDNHIDLEEDYIE